MEYSDQWWKGKYSTDINSTDTDTAVHGTCGHTGAAYSPDGYDNSEWWGIMGIAGIKNKELYDQTPIPERQREASASLCKFFSTSPLTWSSVRPPF